VYKQKRRIGMERVWKRETQIQEKIRKMSEMTRIGGLEEETRDGLKALGTAAGCWSGGGPWDGEVSLFRE